MHNWRERCTFAGYPGYNADDDDDDAMDNNVSNDGNGATSDNLDDDGHGATGDDVDHDGDGVAYNDIDDNCDGATGDEVDNDGKGAKLLLPSMCRCLCPCRNSVVALIVMSLLPSLMHRHLAIVDNDGI